MNTKKLLFALVSMMILVACSPELTAPTESAEIVVQVTNTLVPEPTETAVSTSTPTATLLPTATVTKMPALQPTKTQTSTPVPTSSFTTVSELMSPDGKWLAVREEHSVPDSENLESRDIVFRVTSIENEVEWIAEEYRAEDFWDRLGGPEPLFWSPDEQYLFFTHIHPSDGCYPGGPYSDFWRLDLQTGEAIEIVPSRVAYDYLLSPDGNTVAYLTDDGAIVFYEIVSGSTKEILFESKPDDNVHISAIWSPDSSMLMVQLRINLCTLENESSLIARIDVATLEKTVLLEGVDTFCCWYGLDSWPELDVVLLKENGRDRLMNPWTGEVVSGN